MTIASPAAARNRSRLHLSTVTLLLATLSSCATDEGTRFASFEGDWLLTSCTIIEDNSDWRTKPCDSSPFVLTVDSAGGLHVSNFDVDPAAFPAGHLAQGKFALLALFETSDVLWIVRPAGDRKMRWARRTTYNFLGDATPAAVIERWDFERVATGVQPQLQGR